MSEASASGSSFTVNVERFTGFASTYDAHRPQPPEILCEILSRLAQVDRPGVVVDLGCGTGLSTRIWSGRASQVIGIDPSEDMLAQARRQTDDTSIAYRCGFSHGTGLAPQSADIITCSQSLHWMEPQATFEEAARVLRPGGVFAAIDCDWPPFSGSWQLDQAYSDLMGRVCQIESQKRLSEGLRRWAKEEHLSRMQASGCFRFVKEIALHSVEPGDADRYVGLAISQGGLQAVLKAGIDASRVGLDVFRDAAVRLLGDQPRAWYFTYRVRLGVV